MTSPTGIRVRRATVDDLPALVEMWSMMEFDVTILERRLTEFQVAENEEGRPVGAVGLQILGRDGVVHHESFADYSQADILRSALWERMEKIAESQGLLRAWTQEAAPFWDHNGFLPLSPEALRLLPASLDPGSRWLMAVLRKDPLAEKRDVDKEFDAYLKLELQKSREQAETAKSFNKAVTFFAVLIALGVMALALYVFFAYVRR